MRIAVSYQNERLELDVAEERLVGEWHGPRDVPGSDPLGLVSNALEHPRDYPPLRQAVVPGDRVVIALDPEIPETEAVLAAVCQVLERAGVGADGITVLAPSKLPALRLPDGVTVELHDADDRTHLAYLSTTTSGQRVYLNRHVTDADFVLPVGRIGFDPVLGYRGPWSAIFPDLGDTEAQRTVRSQASDEPADASRARPAFTASTEVSWLLGSQFHLGLVAGVSGISEAIAGLESTVRTEGIRALDRLWSFDAGHRAELVVAGVGSPGRTASVAELAEGLATATRLVQRGGKVVVLSRVEGPFGPGVRRLMGAEDPRAGETLLRGHESDRDYPTARQFAHALAWADVYLLSNLPADEVEDLSIIALGRPEETRRLVANAGSCTFVSQAERTRAEAAERSEV